MEIRKRRNETEKEKERTDQKLLIIEWNKWGKFLRKL